MVIFVKVIHRNVQLKAFWKPLKSPQLCIGQVVSEESEGSYCV